MQTCASGKKKRTRTVTTAAKGGGKGCRHLEEAVNCNTRSCAVPCEVFPWAEWGECSATCDGGVKERTRVVSVQAANGGHVCPVLSESEVCNTTPCASEVLGTPDNPASSCLTVQQAHSQEGKNSTSAQYSLFVAATPV